MKKALVLVKSLRISKEQRQACCLTEHRNNYYYNYCLFYSVQRNCFFKAILIKLNCK